MSARRRTVNAALRRLVGRPREVLWRGWNWKSAITSSLVRGTVFLLANLPAGVEPAIRAMAVELVVRAATGGFYGAITENFRTVRPRRHGMLAAIIVLPVLAHSLELAVHLVNGTPRLALSLGLSVGLTVFSTSFNLFAMQRRVLIVGRGRRPLVEDFALIPGLVVEFVRAVAGLRRPAAVTRVRSRRLSERRA